MSFLIFRKFQAQFLIAGFSVSYKKNCEYYTIPPKIRNHEKCMKFMDHTLNAEHRFAALYISSADSMVTKSTMILFYSTVSVLFHFAENLMKFTYENKMKITMYTVQYCNVPNQLNDIVHYLKFDIRLAIRLRKIITKTTGSGSG